MLPRLIASLLCLLGAAAAGLGVASATVWRPSDTLSASATSDTYLVTDPGVLDLAADTVTVTAHADGPVVVALGRTADVDAWIGADQATHVTGLASRTELATEVGTGSAGTASPGTATPSGSGSATASATESASPTDSTSPTESASPTQSASPTYSASPTDSASADASASPTDGATDAAPDAGTATAADPTGSDLWVDQVTGTGTAVYTWQREAGRWSVLVAAPDGGPVELTLVWPQVVTTPWLRPGLIVGGVLLALGVLWWVLLGLRAWRPALGAGLVGRAARLWDTLVPIPAGAAVLEDAPTRTGRHSRVAPATTTAEPEAPAVPSAPGRRSAPVRWTVARPEPAVAPDSAERETAPADRPAVGPEAPSAAPAAPAPDAHEPAAHEPAVEPGAAASRAEEAPRPSGEVPLTRRALREKREREERERAAALAAGARPGGSPSESTAEEAPVPAVPTATAHVAEATPAVQQAPDTEQTSRRRGRRARSEPAQDGAAVDGHPVMPAWSTPPVDIEPPVHTDRPAPTPAPLGSARSGPVEPSSAPAPGTPEPGPAPAERPRGGRARRGFGRLRRQRDAVEPWLPEPEPEEPVALPEPPTVSGPSGDAWRRAWGLPAATTQAREQRFGADPRASKEEDR